jgi:hypothetical protein
MLWVVAVPLIACRGGSAGGHEGTGSSGGASTDGTRTSGTSTSGGSPSGGSPSGGVTEVGDGTGDTGEGTGTTSSGGASAEYIEPDAIVGGPCADSPTPVSPPCSYSPEQVYCRLSAPNEVIMAVCSAAGRDQCEVIDDCEPGWHACTATDYVARGGRDVVPDFSSNTDRAWLAACVQDVGDSRFRNVPCSHCGDASFEPVVQWWCDGEVVYEGGMAGTTLGVVAGPECMRVGSNLPGNGAYWSASFTSGAPSFVMCCLDDL